MIAPTISRSLIRYVASISGEVAALDGTQCGWRHVREGEDLLRRGTFRPPLQDNSAALKETRRVKYEEAGRGSGESVG